MIKPEIKTTYWTFDEKLMSVEGNMAWLQGDGSGRNAFYYIFHPDQQWLKDTLLSCIKVRDDGYVQFYRYPNRGADTMSRDHVSAIILALYINRDYVDLKWILDNLPLQLSRRYWQTLDFWLWQKTLKATIENKSTKRFILKNIFLLLNLLMFIVAVPWNMILRFLLQVKSVEVGEPRTKVQSKWKNWVYQKLLYPQFALYNLAWMIKTLNAEHSLLAWLLRFDAKNPVLKRTLGGKQISKEFYESYTPATGFRYAGVYDNYTDHDVFTLSPDLSEFNDLNKSNLDYFYFQIDEIMQRFDPKIINQLKQHKPIIFY